jgi:hypothetical protein
MEVGPMSAPPIDLRDEVRSILRKLSPALLEVADSYDAPPPVTNPDLDTVLDRIDADEAAAQKLEDGALLRRLEDDFAAYGVPLIDGVAAPLESWAIPILSAFAGPGAPLLSVGLTVACKLAVLALDRWKASHDAALGGA